MAMASLIQAGCWFSPIFSNNSNNSSFRTGLVSPSPFGSVSSSSSSSSNNLNFSSGLRAQAMSTTTQGDFAASNRVENGKNDPDPNPDHLLVLVHGILASPSDWTYAEAELKRRLGRNFLIYASSVNSHTKTFAGIDGAGKRLADEVLQVVNKTESLKRISFLAHSLGGLLARYAIAMLYSESDSSGTLSDSVIDSSVPSRRGMIAGQEPISFITLATPHLGVRGRKQLPFLLGVPFLEKLAPPVAPFVVGRTGKQLFLTDGKPSRPPLLLRMASDCEDGKFLSALRAFKSRTLYANVSYDYMVGWRTSSIRREKELVKPPLRSLDGYKHVVDVEYCPPVSSDGPRFPQEAAKAKAVAQNAPDIDDTVEYHELMEVFHMITPPFMFQVKNEWFHNAGVGVIAHVADSLKQQESFSSYISASL
ncbi:hypothetical protein V6N11_047538 [Hibiscus sabdariffa]|uniref:DUF676 domain-containing protein n=2 Tax=Hibiscus sabdariffa TaxID=183260 RepID=A0ABR2NKR2_9ROSI